MDVDYRIKNNGKMGIKFTKNYRSLTQYDFITHKSPFHCKRTVLNLSEIKVNSPRKIEGRKFILSLREDGCKDNEGEYKLTQTDLSEEELISLRNNIDLLLKIKSEG